MAAYATAAQLVGSYPWTSSLGSADDRDEALAEASSDLDAELVRAWQVPLQPTVPPVIVAMAKRRAAWILLVKRGKNPAEDTYAIQQAVEDDFARLKRIVAAKALAGVTEAGPAVDGAVVLSQPERGWNGGAASDLCIREDRGW